MMTVAVMIVKVRLHTTLVDATVLMTCCQDRPREDRRDDREGTPLSLSDKLSGTDIALFTERRSRSPARRGEASSKNGDQAPAERAPADDRRSPDARD
jgi:hypothetical protein